MQRETSYWETTTFFRPADVAVVGAGLTGLQAALQLKREQPQLDVVVVERAPVPYGASTRNAGFACFGGPTELLADLDAYGYAATLATVRERYAGVRALEEQFSQREIDWVRNGGFELVDDPATRESVRERLPELNALLAEVTECKTTWKVRSEGDYLLLQNELEAQLHPGKLVESLVADCHRAGVRFLFGCPVESVQTVSAGQVDISGPAWGHITATRALITVNAFARQLLPADFPETIRPVRNQVLLSRPLPYLKLRGCYHYHEGYVYFRNVGPDRLLIGGGRHRAGVASETADFGEHPEVADYLVGKLRQWYPERGWTRADFPLRWSGILAQGDGKTPVLRFAEDRVLVAGRLAGMGVALSAALAQRAVRMLRAS